MTLVMVCWILAMVAGVSWARWSVVILTMATLVSALAVQPTLLNQSAGWCGLLAFGTTPWLLAAQRTRHEKRLKRIQAREAMKLNRLQEQTRVLRELQRDNEQLESQIAQITNLYHVTKATTRALRVHELFAFSLEIVPRLLDAGGLRVIDLSRAHDDSPLVLRARRVPDGRLLEDRTNHLLPVEQAIIQQATTSGQPATSETVPLACELPAGIVRLAWAPLWSEQQQPIGVVIADDLPPEQLNILSIVAHQLSLQLARVHFYETIEAMAITDTLTGLFVRRYFLELTAEELLRSKRHGLPCTVIMADLDLFKTKNDTYGHLVGDVVLREVSQLMRKNLRGIDLIARYGGEEFILLLVETDANEALPVAERIRQLVEVQPIRAYDETLTQTVSMGLSCFPTDGETLQELIEHADEALYAAKRAGRNQITRWSPGLKAGGSRLEATA